jgi:hypothetical protein
MLLQCCLHQCQRHHPDPGTYSAVLEAVPAALLCRCELELACQPDNVLTATISVHQLQLPPALLPSNCSMQGFIDSPRCSLLEVVPQGGAKVGEDWQPAVVC